MKIYHSSNMTTECITVLRGEKIAKIIENISQLYSISLDDAADIYYNSDTSILIEEGIADLHCRSEKYLAQCVWDEHLENTKAAIEEARSGKLRNVAPIDTSSVEAMFKSMGL